jgi:hypothetical protein
MTISTLQKREVDTPEPKPVAKPLYPHAFAKTAVSVWPLPELYGQTSVAPTAAEFSGGPMQESTASFGIPTIVAFVSAASGAR